LKVQDLELRIQKHGPEPFLGIENIFPSKRPFLVRVVSLELGSAIDPYRVKIQTRFMCFSGYLIHKGQEVKNVLKTRSGARSEI